MFGRFPHGHWVRSGSASQAASVVRTAIGVALSVALATLGVAVAVSFEAMRRGPVRRLLAMCAASVAVLAACSPVTIDLPTSCSPICTGTIRGAAYTILMPRSWNGTLLLYSHGYRVDSGRRAEKPALSQSDTTGTGRDRTSQALLAAGYALTGSSYSSNGWAVHDAVVAANDLHQRFIELVGQPKRTYVWGSSLGGLITELIAERFGWVDGAAPMCGVVAGPLLTFDHLLESAVLTKALLFPGFQIGGWTNQIQARRELLAVRAAVRRAAMDYVEGGVAKVVFIAALLGLPNRTQRVVGNDLRSFASAADQILEGRCRLPPPERQGWRRPRPTARGPPRIRGRDDRRRGLPVGTRPVPRAGAGVGSNSAWRRQARRAG